MSDKLRYLIIGIASVGVIVAGIMVFTTYNEYRKAEEEYSGLEQYVGQSQPSEGADEGNAKGSKEETREFRQNFNRADFPDMEIDYAGLHDKNRDYIGWIYVGSAGISYPR